MADRLRSFRCIAFSAGGADSILTVPDILRRNGFRNKLSRSRILTCEDGGVSVAHQVYRSTEPFLALPEYILENMRDPDTDAYHCDLYYMSLSIRRKNIFLVAAQYLPVARLVFDALDRAMPGSQRKYQVLNLQRLLRIVTSGEHEGGKVNIKSVNFVVTGEPNRVSQLILKGKDCAPSKSHTLLSHSERCLKSVGVRDAAPKYIPQKCEVEYDNHAGGKFTLSSDRHGNYIVRIHKDESRLFSAHLLWKYFYDNDLIDVTGDYPLDRVLASTVDTDDES